MCKYIVWGQSAEFISVTACGGSKGLSEVKNVKGGAVKACRKHEFKILLILNPCVALAYYSSGGFGMSSVSSTSIVY